MGSQVRALLFPPSGPVAQLVRALACHARGRGFEPHPGRQLPRDNSSGKGQSRLLASVAQLVEQGTENPRVVGSIPTGGTTYADLAHLVERDLAKVEVAGSSPVIRSKQKIRLRRKADFLFCIIHCSHIIRRKLKPIEKAETSLKFALFGKMQVLLDKIQSKFCCILVRTMI